MRALLIDDEYFALAVLERTLKGCEDVRVVGKYTEPYEALEVLEDTDVVFLDIEMGEVSGLDFAEEILRRNAGVEIVFVTAYSQYAVDAFEVNAVDYLLKPVSQERARKALEKVRSRRRPDHANPSDNALKLRCMGAFRAYNEGEPVKWRTRKVKELLAYLISHLEQPVSQERLKNALWEGLPDDKATTLLHTTVYQLRKSLKDMGHREAVLYLDFKYCLNLHFDCDAGRIQELTHRREDLTEREMTELLALYQGDFMEEEYYSWTGPRQLEMRSAILRLLEKYARRHLKEPFTEEVLLKMMEMDPYHEDYAALLYQFYKGMNILKGHTFKTDFEKRMKTDLGLLVRLS